MVIKAKIECDQCGKVSDGITHTIGKTVLEICPRCLKQLKEWFTEVLDS